MTVAAGLTTAILAQEPARSYGDWYAEPVRAYGAEDFGALAAAAEGAMTVRSDPVVNSPWAYYDDPTNPPALEDLPLPPVLKL